MSGYAPFDGLVAVTAAVAVILFAIISLAGTASRRQAVAAGAARTADLCELTGILDPRRLQDVFGPPDMDRVWRRVTLVQVDEARAPLGHVISSDWVDYGCIGAAILSFLSGHPLVQLALLLALAIQIAGVVIVSRLPR